MQLHRTILATLLASSLVACGGSLEGGSTDPTDPTPTPAPTDPTPVPELPAPAEPGVPSSFVFVGASPNWIAVKGTGGIGRQESSIVGFKLIDRNGDAVEGIDVDFSLTAPTGTTIDPLTGTTNADGVVTTTVLSGRVSGPIRVGVVTSEGSGITTISESISVSTGLPTQEGISISFENHAPQGLNIDGVTSGVTIRLSDRYRNAVPDGTTVYFTTEGGAIRDAETGTLGSCLTTASKCSLTWESQNPRPEGNRLDIEGLSDGCAAWAYSEKVNFGPCINIGGMGRPYGGRSTITAYVMGEEIFVDNDGDGWFTAGDDFFAKNDLPEVFYDHNEDGYYKGDSNAVNVGDEKEEYADLSPKDGLYSPGNGIYNGLLCSDASEGQAMCSKEPVYVRTSGVLTMSGSHPYIRVQNNGSDTGHIDLTGSNTEQTLTVYLADIHNNPPPTGSTVTITTDNGQFSGPTSWDISEVPSYPINNIGPFYFTFTMIQEETPNQKTSGKAVVTITTPGGNGIPGSVTTHTMTVIDDAAPEVTPTPTP